MNHQGSNRAGTKTPLPAWKHPAAGRQDALNEAIAPGIGNRPPEARRPDIHAQEWPWAH